MSIAANDGFVTPESLSQNAFFQALVQLRDEFHRHGRYDDSNVKLDEITKLIFLKLGEAQGHFTLTPEGLNHYSLTHFGTEGQYALALRSLFTTYASQTLNQLDGLSFFGSHAQLNLQATEDRLARRLAEILATIPFFDTQNGSPSLTFDVLNESFGYFVRENFRNNKDDAQYMTPWEVARPIAELAIAEATRSAPYPAPLIVCDPACGVGTLLSSVAHALIAQCRSQGCEPAIAQSHVQLIGQDKVDRMVRLARLNMALFGYGQSAISQGNSLLGPSELDQWIGQVDLVLTNPPFRAKYRPSELFQTQGAERYVILPQLCHTFPHLKWIDSELAVLDRSLALLKPGGHLGIIVPDHLVSRSGLYRAVRQWLETWTQIKAVIELPAVTFAQANTRAKTCFLFLQKGANAGQAKPIFMGTCQTLGYEVHTRTGAPIKVPSHLNQLTTLVATYRSWQQSQEDTSAILGNSAQAVAVPMEQLLNGKWTPRFYRSERLETLSKLQTSQLDDVDLVLLSDLASLQARSRPKQAAIAPIRCISVLHLDRFGSIDWQAVETYKPKGLGRMCAAGDLLLSRINPRTPRMAVVPPTPYPLVCSTEFEILEPQAPITSYALWALLMSEPVQQQIQALTCGTSASHNRIQSSELQQVIVPVPKPGTLRHQHWTAIAQQLEATLTQLYSDRANLAQTLKQVTRLTALSQP